MKLFSMTTLHVLPSLEKHTGMWLIIAHAQQIVLTGSDTVVENN